MTKVLSVIVPSYNASNFLKEDIPFFLDDRVVDDIEIIIVNDGSKDDTLKTAQKFCSEYPETIICIDKENGGHGSTINAGVGIARGKYFKVVDADDWVDTDAFVEFVKYLDHVNTDLVVAPYTAVFTNKHSEEVRCQYDFELDKEYDFNRVCLELNGYSMHAVTYKTVLVQKQHKLTEKCFYVDMEYICNPIKDIETVSFFNKSVYQYRLGDVEQSVSIKNRQKYRNMQKRVTLNVLTLLDDQTLSVEKRQFLERMTGLLIENQTDTLLSFGLNRSIKSELFVFYSDIQKINDSILNKVKGKKVNLLRKYGEKIYYPLALAVKITRTYH